MAENTDSEEWRLTQLLSISKAAKRLGVHQKTLRAWADKGLVPHSKTPTGFRMFDPEVIDELRNELRGDAAGKLAA